MKLGCVIAAPDVAHGPLALLSGSFEEKLAKARAFGFVGVELMVVNPARLDPVSIRAKLDANALEVPQVVTGELFGQLGLALVHPDKAICDRARERLRQVISFAGTLGNSVIVNIGRVRGRLDWLGLDDPTEGIRRFVAVFQYIADFAQRCGVRITIEPCNRYEVDFVHNAQEALALIELVNRDNFGLMLDLFHMNIEDQSFEESFRAAAGTLWHVHIADSNRHAPGWGHLDFDAIMAALRAVGYDGYVSGEMLPWPDADWPARQTGDFMQRFLDYT